MDSDIAVILEEFFAGSPRVAFQAVLLNTDRYAWAKPYDPALCCTLNPEGYPNKLNKDGGNV